MVDMVEEWNCGGFDQWGTARTWRGWLLGRAGGGGIFGLLRGVVGDLSPLVDGASRPVVASDIPCTRQTVISVRPSSKGGGARWLRVDRRTPPSRAGYYCSWDINDSKPVSLFIPSEGIQLLVEDLTKGKLFGYKLSILYSGRAMALWDFSALAGTALASGSSSTRRESLRRPRWRRAYAAF